MQLRLFILLPFLLAACGTTLPLWRTVSVNGVSQVQQAGDVATNPQPATPSTVQAFELIDFHTPVRLGYFVEDYDVPTPLTIPDATIITTLQLLQLLQEASKNGDRPLLMDVRSDDKSLVTLRGAWWFNGLGYAFEDEILEKQMDERMNLALQPNTRWKVKQPLIFFCANPHCALSYNAARRASLLGYQGVYWYRGGVEAWYLAGLPLVRLEVNRSP